jgi:uncharacterized membrane protein (DUF485 family)
VKKGEIMKRRTLFNLITVAALISPTLYLGGVISKTAAMPLMFGVLAIQQIFAGVYIINNNKKLLKRLSIGLGLFFLVFSISLAALSS